MNDSTNPMERIHHEQLRALLGRGMFSTVDAMLALDMHEPQGSRTMTALQAAGYIRSVERTADSPYVEQWATEADADLPFGTKPERWGTSAPVPSLQPRKYPAHRTQLAGLPRLRRASRTSPSR